MCCQALRQGDWPTPCVALLDSKQALPGCCLTADMPANQDPGSCLEFTTLNGLARPLPATLSGLPQPQHTRAHTSTHTATSATTVTGSGTLPLVQW